MCQSFPGFRCYSEIKSRLLSAQASYEEHPNTSTHHAYLLAQHEYSMTQRGLRESFARGEIRAVLETMNEREERLAAEARFKEWAKTASREAAAETRKRLRDFDPYQIIGVEEGWKGDQEFRPAKSSRAVELAYNLAVKAHAGVKRRSGEPYVNHPLRVHYRLSRANSPLITEETLIVALLHDAIEDSPLTLTDLRIYGFNERVISGVEAVTKRGGESYPDAICRAAANIDARWVKLFDNFDNSRPGQLEVFTELKRLKQRRKYFPAMRFLKAVIHHSINQQQQVA